jgi:hypothetical protein
MKTERGTGWEQGEDQSNLSFPIDNQKAITSGRSYLFADDGHYGIGANS